MTRLENRVRQTLGPALPEEAVQEGMRLVWAALATAVGRRLVDELTDEEVQELERIRETDGQDAARRWLFTQCPHHPRVIEDETTGILARLARIHG